MALMEVQGIADSSETVAAGIGAIIRRRVQDFCMQMVKAGLSQPGEVDMLKVAALKFFNRHVGQDLKVQLRKSR